MLQDCDGKVTKAEWIMFVQNVASLGRLSTLQTQLERARMNNVLMDDLERIRSTV